MILLATVLFCMARGELRYSKFELRDRNKVGNGLQLTIKEIHLLVPCGSRCLSSTKCTAFQIVRDVCEILNHTCQRHGRQICYEMVTPVFKRREETTRTINTNQPESYTPQPPPGKERLLIVPSCQKIPPKMYDLQTRSIEDYHDPGLVNVKCMVFMPITQQLLLGLVKPCVVQIYSKDGRNTIADYYVISLAFDEKSKLVFMVKNRSYDIYKTKIDGKKNAACLYRNRNREVQDMVADMNAKVLYVACWKGLVGLSYHGTLIDILDKKKEINCLALDVEHAVLYYSPAFKLKRVFLRNRKSELVFTHLFMPNEMVYYNGTVFFSFVGKDKVFQMNISKNPSRRVIDNLYWETKCLHIAMVTI